MSVISTTPRAIVPGSLYGVTNFSTAPDLNQLGAYMHVFNQHRLSRMRRGHSTLSTPLVARKIKISCGDIANVTSVKVMTWRWTGATYTRTWVSENIRSLLTSGTGVVAVVNEVTLLIPNSGFAEGENTSVEMIASGAITGAWCGPSVALVGGQTSGNIRYTQTDPGPNFNWDVASVLSNRIFQVQVMVDSAPIGWWGDSHMAGAYEHTSYAADRPVAEEHNSNDVEGTWSHQFRLLSGLDYEPLGIGGEESDDTFSDARIAAFLAQKTRAAVIMTGWNNIRNGGVDKAAYLADLAKGIKALRDDGQLVFVMEWSPIDGATNAHHVLADEWLVDTKALSGVVWVPLRNRVGVARVGGTPTPPAGNRWNWKTGFAGPDTIHPNNACKREMAAALWDVFEGLEAATPTVRLFQGQRSQHHHNVLFFDNEVPVPMKVEIYDGGDPDLSFAEALLTGKLSIDGGAEVTVPVVNNGDGTAYVLWQASVAPVGTKRESTARLDIIATDGEYVKNLPRFTFPVMKRV